MDPKRIVGVVLMVICFIIFSISAVYCIFFSSANSAPAIAIFCIVGMAVMALVAIRTSGESTHIRATQSNRTLGLASKTVTYMREGLNLDSAQAVCDLLLDAVTAVSVAITDTQTIQGFSGVDRVNHEQGTTIQTEVTMQTLVDGKTRVVDTASAIGFKGDGAAIKGAIIVPLVVHKEIKGTLKFYYTAVSRMDEDQIAMAEGFGELLSTQLSLSYLEQQTELATRMELKALQAQINPHFLFNTINTIASITRTDPAKAREMLREFAVYYRRLLENSEDLIALDQEVDQVKRYLVFQRARFGEEAIVMTIDGDERLRKLPVPAFIIQPMVENSIGHARRPDGSPLHIVIKTRIVGDDAIIDVTDDGVGIAAEALPNVVSGGSKTGMGIAMKNVNKRLQTCYGDNSGLSVDSELGVGTTVTLTLRNAAGRIPSVEEQE